MFDMCGKCPKFIAAKSGFSGHFAGLATRRQSPRVPMTRRQSRKMFQNVDNCGDASPRQHPTPDFVFSITFRSGVRLR